MLDNHVVVVTGGAGLIGKEFCRAISSHGGIAVVADINKSAAEEVARDIQRNQGIAIPAQLDICDPSSVNRLILDLENQYEGIYAVINNAYPRNKNYGRKLEDIEYEDFCENLNLHLGGYFLVSQHFAKYFKRFGTGVVINMASIYGVMAPRFNIYEGTKMTMPLEYASIKGGILQMTRYFAQYFKKDGIRFNCISPGGVLDNQPQEFLENYKNYCGKKGMLQVSDLIGCLLFLLSPEAKFITGQNIIVDDGFSL